MPTGITFADITEAKVYQKQKESEGYITKIIHLPDGSCKVLLVSLKKKLAAVSTEPGEPAFKELTKLKALKRLEKQPKTAEKEQPEIGAIRYMGKVPMRIPEEAGFAIEAREEARLISAQEKMPQLEKKRLDIETTRANLQGQLADLLPKREVLKRVAAQGKVLSPEEQKKMSILEKKIKSTEAQVEKLSQREASLKEQAARTEETIKTGGTYSPRTRTALVGIHRTGQALEAGEEFGGSVIAHVSKRISPSAGLRRQARPTTKAYRIGTEGAIGVGVPRIGIIGKPDANIPYIPHHQDSNIPPEARFQTPHLRTALPAQMPKPQLPYFRGWKTKKEESDKVISEEEK